MKNDRIDPYSSAYSGILGSSPLDAKIGLITVAEIDPMIVATRVSIATAFPLAYGWTTVWSIAIAGELHPLPRRYSVKIPVIVNQKLPYCKYINPTQGISISAFAMQI